MMTFDTACGNAQIDFMGLITGGMWNHCTKCEALGSLEDLAGIYKLGLQDS